MTLIAPTASSNGVTAHQPSAEETSSEIGILGPLGMPKWWKTPTATKRRQLLALLASSAEEVVPISRIIHELWGAQPPRSAVTTVQTYILNLRNGISRELVAKGIVNPKQLLETRPIGYCLRLGDKLGLELDLRRFEKLQEGLKGVERDSTLDAPGLTALSTRLAEALDLFRGPPLVDVQIGPELQIVVAGLEEARLSLLTRRIRADLRLGGHLTVLTELAELCTRYPLDEAFRAMQMIALYRAGRLDAALESFRRLRGSLVAELGVEPPPKLQALQRLILARDVRLGDPQYVG